MFTEYQDRIWVAGKDISPHQTQQAESLRVPLLTTSQPHWTYITGIVVADSFPDIGILPDPEEITAVAECLEKYCDRWYNDSFQRVMREFAPYDIDSGANLGYFIKHPDGGWSYRKRTWTQGAYWVPQPAESTYTIGQIIDRSRR